MKEILLQQVALLEVMYVELAALISVTSDLRKDFRQEFEKAKEIAETKMLPSIQYIREGIESLP